VHLYFLVTKLRKHSRMVVKLRNGNFLLLSCAYNKTWA